MSPLPVALLCTIEYLEYKESAMSKKKATEAKAAVEKIMADLDEEIEDSLKACIDQSNVKLFAEAFKGAKVKPDKD